MKIHLVAFIRKKNIYFSVLHRGIICAMTSARLIAARLARGKTVYLHPDMSTPRDARELPARSVQYEVNGHASINRTVRWTVTPRIYPPINQLNGIFPWFPTRRSSLNGVGVAASARVILASSLSMERRQRGRGRLLEYATVRIQCT